MYRKNVNRSNNPKKTMKKGIIAALLAFTLIIGSFAIPSVPDSDNPVVTVVEASAKKDKKKPVIKFSGKTNITVENNEVVKIPKTTAKDNKDGNVTKKISITVKKGKTSYKSIATKIKNNKKVKFSSTGKYTVTYTVKDKAGNKATKKRYITVVGSKKVDTSDETTQTTTQQKTEPTTQATTEAVTTGATTEQKTTQEKTTEASTEEKSKVETPIIKYPILAPPVEGDGDYKIHIVYRNGIRYEVVNDTDFAYKIEKASKVQDKITANIENDYLYLVCSKESRLVENVGFLDFIGEIKAYDENGLDISAGVTIYAPIINKEKEYNTVYIYVEDTGGESLAIPIHLYIEKWDEDYKYEENTFGQTYKMLSKDPLVYGCLREYFNTNQYSSVKN